jgi:hypothetical protein
MSKMKTVGMILATVLASLTWNGPVRAGEIHDAARAGDVEKVRALLKANPGLVNANDKDTYGKTPLFEAARWGHMDVVELLLSKSAKVNAKDNRGDTPLFGAVSSGHMDVVTLLLSKGAEVNARANDGCTPLHEAAYLGHKEVVELLLTHKAEPDAKDKDGWTPLGWAEEHDLKDIANLLRQHGATVRDTPAIRQWYVGYSGVAAPKVVLCQDDEAWVGIWQRVQKDVPVHLRTNQLGVAIFIGQRPTGGYGARVMSAEVTAGSYVVKYKEETPRGVVTEAITTPCVFAIVPHTNLPIKVTKDGGSEPGFANAPAQGREAGDDWIQQYYQHPSPERFEAEVRKTQMTGAFSGENGRYAGAAFFARLFAANGERVQGWMSVVDSFPEEDRKLFILALRWADTPATAQLLQKYASGGGTIGEYAGKVGASTPPTFKTLTHPTADELDGCWGSFFATGDKDYVLTIVRCATAIHDQSAMEPSQYAARWSLKSLCTSHAGIARIKDHFYQTASESQKRSLDELFADENPGGHY